MGRTVLASYANPGFTWSDLRHLRELTVVPLLVRGILHPDDACHALEVGADGIAVSNHGGRQVDGAVATMDVFEGIRAMVDSRLPVLLVKVMVT